MRATRPRLRSLVAGLSLAAATLVGLPATASASGTSAPGYCTDSIGVTVVVDFQDLPGGVVVRCFTHPTSSSTGLDALQGAGFRVTGVARYGNDSFVCRIDGEPKPADEACIDTPPATDYWSYWYASNGGTWKYSALGAMSHQVIRGGFEGWSFSHNKTAGATPPPRVAPNHAIAAKPTPTPRPSSSSPAVLPHRTSTPATSASSHPTMSGSASTTTMASTSPAPPDSSASAGAAVGGGGSSGPPVSFDVAASTSGGGSPWSSIAGIALAVAALGGAAVVAVRRKRDRLAGGG